MKIQCHKNKEKKIQHCVNFSYLKLSSVELFFFGVKGIKF